MDYFVQNGNQQQGPYDAVAIIRKIRNFTISADTVLFREYEESGVPAIQMPEFHDIFRDLEEESALPGSIAVPRLTFAGTIKDGFEFLKHHTSSTVLTGVMLFGWLFSVVIFSKFVSGIPLGILSSVTGYFLFVMYQLCILRKSRMQLLTREFYRAMFKKYWLRLLTVSFITSASVFFLPVAVGAFAGPVTEYFLILIPGTFILTFLFFAPMLVFDRGISAGQAIKMSIVNLRRLGFDNVLVIYLLILVNFSPLIIITLPVTMGALCEIYDSHFNEY